MFLYTRSHMRAQECSGEGGRSRAGIAVASWIGGGRYGIATFARSVLHEFSNGYVRRQVVLGSFFSLPPFSSLLLRVILLYISFLISYFILLWNIDRQIFGSSNVHQVQTFVRLEKEDRRNQKEWFSLVFIIIVVIDVISHRLVNIVPVQTSKKVSFPFILLFERFFFFFFINVRSS